MPQLPRLNDAAGRVDCEPSRCAECSEAGRDELPAGANSFPRRHSSLQATRNTITIQYHAQLVYAMAIARIFVQWVALPFFPLPPFSSFHFFISLPSLPQYASSARESGDRFKLPQAGPGGTRLTNDF